MGKPIRHGWARKESIVAQAVAGIREAAKTLEAEGDESSAEGAAKAADRIEDKARRDR